MSKTKDALKNALLGNNSKSEKLSVNGEEAHNVEQSGKSEVKKRRRGRPSISHKATKLDAILKHRGMTRKDLYQAILEKYPNEPISPDAVSRIVSGKRVYYSTTTLYRICGALGITPNMALNWEEEV